MKTKRKKRERLPQITWRGPFQFASGSRYWDSACGIFRLHCSERIGEILLPREWRLYQFRAGMWNRVAEARGRTRLEKLARQRAAALDTES